MVRRSLMVLGMAVAVLIFGFVALFAIGGSGNLSGTGFPTIPTTTIAKSSPTTSTTIVTLKAPNGTSKRHVIDLVTVPNVVGMTLAQSDAELSVVGLPSGISSDATEPSGTSSTGTVLAQTPAAGSLAQPGQVIQLTVSGY
jgi:hypothetical protein